MQGAGSQMIGYVVSERGRLPRHGGQLRSDSKPSFWPHNLRVSL